MEVHADEVWWLTTDQMRDVDRITMQRFGVDLARMMENAGRALAELAIVRFSPSSVIVLAGSGGNGGGGMVAARHLAGRGVEVAVTLSSPYQMSPVPAEQLAILDRLGVPQLHAPRSADLVIDALVGYGLTNSPAGRVAELISWANDQSSPILALDVPSGLDSTSGVAGRPCVSADATLTVAMPKTGLRQAPEVGELFLADISIPPAVYRQLGFPELPSPFRSSTTVRVLRDV